MASVSPVQAAVHGRLDRLGRLISADSQLEQLQRQAGSELGQDLALPQVAAVARLAAKLGTTVARPAIAASPEDDIALWVVARPEDDEMALSLEGWTARPAAAPRLGPALEEERPAVTAAPEMEWATDEALRVVSLSPAVAKILGAAADETVGAPLTRVVRLEQGSDGEMPLLDALAARHSFSGQRARSRSDEARLLIFDAEPVSSADGSFAGFRGRVRAERQDDATAATPELAGFDRLFAELLRSCTDRIIDSAEEIANRRSGPLQSGYAVYGADIASSARHLAGILSSIGEPSNEPEPDTIDLSALVAEAVIMLEPSAQEHGINLELEPPLLLRARGDERAVMQVLLNLIGNAIRYSPAGGTVRLTFSKTGRTASVTVADQGPGVAADDAERIFERFERAHTKEGTGLGLAISRRLARSLGGDVTLDSTPDEGARFTLTLAAG